MLNGWGGGEDIWDVVKNQTLWDFMAAWVKGTTEMKVLFFSPSLPLDFLQSVTELASPRVSQHLPCSSPRVLSWGEAPAAPHSR